MQGTFCHLNIKKSRIWETKHLSTNADSSTAATQLLSIILGLEKKNMKRGETDKLETDWHRDSMSYELWADALKGHRSLSLKSEWAYIIFVCMDPWQTQLLLGHHCYWTFLKPIITKLYFWLQLNGILLEKIPHTGDTNSLDSLADSRTDTIWKRLRNLSTRPTRPRWPSWWKCQKPWQSWRQARELIRCITWLFLSSTMTTPSV